jgi:dipeptidyl aminopeptidase/acylaminoacyl peptidase
MVACKPQEMQQVASTPKNIQKPLSTHTPRPTDTLQLTVTPLVTETAKPSACSKSKIPAELLPTQTASENKKLIALTSGGNYIGDTESEVYVMNFDGSQVLNISNNPASDGDPIWSPDGQKIAFLSFRNSPINYSCHGPSSDCVPELFSIKPDGSGLKQITKGITYFPAWSPNGKQLAFVHYFKVDPSLSPSGGENESMLSDIYLVDANGSNLQNLTNKPSIYRDVVWSPDGQHLAFTISWPTNSIGIIDSDGTNLSIYSDIPAKEISWIPEGTNLVFLSYDDDIYKISAEFTQVDKITSTPKAHKSLMKLSQDGKWLVYQLNDSESLCNQIRALNMENFQDYFVYDVEDVEKLSDKSSGIPFLPSSLGIDSIELTQDGAQLIFTQMIRFDSIIAELPSTFSISLDGTNLKQFGTSDITSPSIQP